MTQSAHLVGRFRGAHVLSRLSVHLLCNVHGSIAECNKFHLNLHLLAERRGGGGTHTIAPRHRTMCALGGNGIFQEMYFQPERNGRTHSVSVATLEHVVHP